MKVELTI